MSTIDDLKTQGVSILIGAARRGDHTLPQAILDDYTEAEAIEAEHVDRWGRVTDSDAQAAISRLGAKLGAAHAYGNATSIIVEHLQPALADLLDTFRADMAAAGAFAAQPGPTMDMLGASDKARAAYVRLVDTYPRYGSLRASWQVLARDLHDPYGHDSPLAEVENIDEIAPDWEAARNHRAPWPWPSNVFHVRMGWLLERGARVWLPTPAQLNTAWQRHQAARTAA